LKEILIQTSWHFPCNLKKCRFDYDKIIKQYVCSDNIGFIFLFKDQIVPQKKSYTRKKSTSRGLKKTSKSRTSSRSKSASKQLGKSASKILSNASKLFGDVSTDRKLDIIGILLTLIGLLTILSLFSKEHGTVTGWWVNSLHIIAGWGAFVLPVALILVGLWLVFRKIDNIPTFSPTRTLGIMLLYINILTWIHLIAGGDWALAKSGLGGGYAGAIFERALVITTGELGAYVILSGWFLIGLIFTIDRSIPEMLAPVFEWIRQYRQEKKQTSMSAPRRELTRNIQPELPLAETPIGFKRLDEDEPERSRPKKSRKAEPASDTPSTQTPETVQTVNLPATPTQVEKTAATEPAPQTGNQEAPMIEPKTIRKGFTYAWQLPQIDQILDPATKNAVQSNIDQERANLIEETLASFGAPAHVVDIQRGPTVTLYGVEPDYVESRGGRTRVRVNKITSLQDDLALALAAASIRIQAPVPGKGYIGIEVPNAEINTVSLREVLESAAFKKLKSPLTFSLGQNVSGKSVAVDLIKMPHMLIAGTTGSGKSVCVNAILSCFLMNNTPDDLRLVLVDPKRVELTGYNSIPHLLAPVVVEANRVVGVLQWILREMDSRYHKFSQTGCRNIQEFNKKFKETKLPYLVVIIDELADLMMLAPDETERSITRLAQLSRATGIHLILATQRPSTDVITGLIKANFPARIAFTVAAGVDSRVILDQPGAERLLGRGDMLFQAPDAPAPVRLQGVFVSDIETQRLVDFWQNQTAEAKNLQEERLEKDEGYTGEPIPRGAPLQQTPLWEEMEKDPEADPLLEEATDLVRREGRASITMLQRRMRIGYTRAARIIDMMEDKAIISPPIPHSQHREVLDYGPTAPPKDDWD
jgi:S-DNA-T family DNA segregation ATPase FtsK/SpoIIIE